MYTDTIYVCICWYIYIYIYIFLSWAQSLVGLPTYAVRCPKRKSRAEMSSVPEALQIAQTADAPQKRGDFRIGNTSEFQGWSPETKQPMCERVCRNSKSVFQDKGLYKLSRVERIIEFGNRRVTRFYAGLNKFRGMSWNMELFGEWFNESIFTYFSM